MHLLWLALDLRWTMFHLRPVNKHMLQVKCVVAVLVVNLRFLLMTAKT